jgi:putative MATE family efflux protein
MFKVFKKDNLQYKLFAIATPIIVQNLVHYVQLQIDMAMLGRSNIHFLSAVGNVLFPYTIIISFLTALSAGATVLISHSVGAKSLNSARRFAEVSFFYNVLMAIPFFLLLFLFANTLMVWMGTSGQINFYSTQFMKSLSFSVLFLSVELSIVAILQGVGKTRSIMFAAILCTLTNILFDWLLIYGHWGFPVLGISGAGIATSLANFIGMTYLIITYVTTKRLPFKPALKGIFNPRWSIQKKNIIVGLPYGLEAMFWSFGQIVIIRLVNEIDDYAAGVYVLITRIQAMTFFFYLGIAKATMIMVGQEIGSGNKPRAFKVGYLSLKYAFALCIMASVIFLAIPEQILSVFTSEQGLIKSAVPLLNIISITIFPVAVNVIIGNAIRGLKDTKWMFYTQTFGTIFTIVFSAILLFVFHLGLRGIFITVLFDEFIRAALNYNRFYSYVISKL